MDDLRERLSNIDPMSLGVQVADVSDPHVQSLLEAAMTATIEEPGTGSLSRRRRWLVGAAAAVVAAAVAVAGVLVARVGDESEPSRLALTLPETAGVMASCVPFDVAFLRDMPIAFAGTVTALDGDAVTIDVDRWYRAAQEDSADVVEVTIPAAHTSASLDGVDFALGIRYLVTATDGVVNGCGFSGEATPELEQAFDAAFG